MDPSETQQDLPDYLTGSKQFLPQDKEINDVQNTVFIYGIKRTAMDEGLPINDVVQIQSFLRNI